MSFLTEKHSARIEMTIFRVLIITSVCSLSAKHVFISTLKSWKSAQEYCRSHFTDLSPITSELEDQVFRSMSQGMTGWIGLYRDANSPTGWKWSGGGYATYQDWAYDLQQYNDYAYWTSNGWYSFNSLFYKSFFCLNLKVVEEKKSWEEALEHCRESQINFTSLLSETELLLAQTEIQHNHITDRVWISLRYLGDHWLWVNGDPLVYQAWSKGGGQDHQCPIKNRCGVLTKEGLWEEWDCQDRLNFICN